MAKKINFKATSDTVKNAMINFYDGYLKIANAGVAFRADKKALDAKFATDHKALKDKLDAEKEKSKKEKISNDIGKLIGQYDNDLKDLTDKRKQAEKEGKSLYKPAYDLLIPYDENEVLYSKKSEESKALYNAYVTYQKTNDFSKFSELFSQFLTSIGYGNIANNVTYQINTARVFEVRLGSMAARSKDLLAGKLVTELSPSQFNKLFLMIFYQILVDNSVVEAPKTTPKAE